MLDEQWKMIERLQEKHHQQESPLQDMLEAFLPSRPEEGMTSVVLRRVLPVGENK